MQTVQDIHNAFHDLLNHENEYQAVLTEFNRLLSIIGNVEGDDIVLLVMVAIDNVAIKGQCQ